MSKPGSLMCIDAGNTLVKWCLHVGANVRFEQPSAFFSRATVDFKPFSDAFGPVQEHLAPSLNSASAVQAVLLSNVLGPDFEQAVRAMCEGAGVPCMCWL